MNLDEQRHLLRCGVPPDDIAALSAPTPTKAMQAVSEFAAGPRKALVLFGSVGTGKTLAAERWLLNAKRWVDEDTWSWDVDGSTMVSARRLFGLNLRFGPERAEFDRLCRMRWLVVDDLGTESDVANVDEFFHERCRRPVKTALTTNMICPTRREGTTTFGERYGARVISRMGQSGLFAFTGTVDLRKASR